MEFYPLERIRCSHLLGHNTPALLEALAERQQQMRRSPGPRRILLCEPDPISLLAGVWAAQAEGWAVFLASPAWGEVEWKQAVQALGSGHILRQGRWQSLPGSGPDLPAWILIPTGGSGGQVRFAIHTAATLAASVGGFCQHFDLNVTHFCCVLPLYHVSGLMQAWRCLLTGGQLTLAAWKDLESGQALPDGEGFLSLVPTQLQRILARPATHDWLRRFRAILIGGGPSWPQLLQQARQARLPLAPTYGMTETASQIATLKPEEFAAGNRSCGRPLPHVQVEVHPGSAIALRSPALALGYYPDLFEAGQPFLTNDAGYLDAAGYLHILGRIDQRVISGGEKVWVEEVEAAIRATHQVEDVCVVGRPDPDWGERVVAICVLKANGTVGAIREHLQQTLSPHKIPKQWIEMAALPRTPQGKLNRPHLQRMAQQDHA